MATPTCGVMTRTERYADPEPAEYCEHEVNDDGDLCDEHESAEEAEHDRAERAYDDYRGK